MEMADGAGRRIPERKRWKHTGRGKGPPFLQLYHAVTDSEEFGALSAHAVKMLLELCRQYRPGKNGDLSAPWSLLCRRGWHSSGTAARSKKELLHAGWIIETRKGGKNKCSLYAVTLWPIDESDKHQEPGTIVAQNLWRKKK
jgi:hypothetical protein